MYHRFRIFSVFFTLDLSGNSWQIERSKSSIKYPKTFVVRALASLRQNWHVLKQSWLFQRLSYISRRKLSFLQRLIKINCPSFNSGQKEATFCLKYWTINAKVRQIFLRQKRFVHFRAFNQVPLVCFRNIYHPASSEYTEVLNLTIGQTSVKYEFVKYWLNMNLSYIC